MDGGRGGGVVSWVSFLYSQGAWEKESVNADFLMRVIGITLRNGRYRV